MLQRCSHPRKLACLLVTTAALLGAGASAAEARLVVGVSDNNANMFTSPWFKKAHVPTARLVVRWDVAVLRNKAALGGVGVWMQRAVLGHVAPMVSFTSVPGPAGSVPPSLAQYTRAVKAFMKVFPEVKIYTPWNEPDFIYNHLSSQPQLAAAYYNTLVSLCHGCTIVAGDVYRPASDGLASWVRSYSRYLKTPPKAWALHPYDDIRGHTVKAILALESVTRGPIWLDEIGGVERRQKWPFPNQSPAGANNDERFLFSLPKRFPRIQRIYHYQWRADPRTTWDSGLLGEQGKPRPAYWTFVNAIRGRLP